MSRSGMFDDSTANSDDRTYNGEVDFEESQTDDHMEVCNGVGSQKRQSALHHARHNHTTLNANQSSVEATMEQLKL